MHVARALIRSLDPKPGQRFGAQQTRYVVPDVIVRKQRDKWTAAINPAPMPTCATAAAVTATITSFASTTFTCLNSSICELSLHHFDHSGA